MLLDPVDSVLDGVFGVTVEDLGLVANFGVGAVHGAGKNDTHTSTILVAVGENTEARNATRAKVKNVSGSREDSGCLPVNRILSDHAHKLGNDVVGALLADVLASVGIVERDTEVGARDDNILEILLKVGVCL